MRKVIFFFLFVCFGFYLNAQCFKQVSAGDRHTVAIKKNGTLWAWGDNTYGQLGNGTNTINKSPIQIGTDTTWRYVSAGYQHTVAIKNDGTLWAWGNNVQNQLGDGTSSNRNSPTQIGTSSNWSNVSAGYYHTIALKTNGTLWSWGSNSYGQLGIGSTNYKPSPVQIDSSSNWAIISAGLFHSIAIKVDGTLWAWGLNNYSQLGDGSTTDQKSPVQIGTANNWLNISGGYHHTVATKTNGTLWAWGANDFGQLGDSTTTTRTSPVQIGLANDWASISAGYSHTIAIKNIGSLWAWGSNTVGQLGNGTNTDKISPVQIGTATNWLSIKTGSYHNATLKIDGSIWTWGYNGYGQLGNGTYTDKISPTQITAGGCVPCISTNSITSIAVNTTQLPYIWNSSSFNVTGIYTVHLTNFAGCDSAAVLNLTVISNECLKKISAGVDYTMSIKTDGSLWALGANDYGQLGDGTTTPKNSPIRVGTDTNWVMVSAGGIHTLAIKTDGTLWAWGANTYGQLGDSTTSNKLSPVKIGTASNWAMVSAGGGHSVAIKTDGTLWAWGANAAGQVGDGTITQRTYPVKVGSSINWLQVSAGSGHTVAIKTNGSLWAWGLNNYNQLGDGTTINKTTPVQIGVATNWAKINGGAWHTVCVKTDSSLWAWGANMYGQLGDGTTTQRSNPIQIGNSMNWASISVGYYHTAAIKTDGSLWTWGRNLEGQLGQCCQGIIVNQRNYPFQILSVVNWEKISAGAYHNICIKADGSIWNWGTNNYGQLGSSTPSMYQDKPLQLTCPSNCLTTTSTTTQSACGSYIWNGITYTQSGSYTKTGLTNISGCDSVATLNLTINPNFSGNIIHPTKGNIYNTGVYYNGTISNFTGGKYNYNCVISGTNVTLKSTKNNDITKANGVTSVDVLLTQRHILNTAKLNSPYKIIAADVDGNKTVNSVDILRMKRLILGTDTTFTKTVGTVKTDRLWEFVDSAYVFPDTTNPFPFKDSISFTNLTSNKTNQTFIGVKLGDVNYDWNPAVARGVAANSLELIVNSEKTTNNNLQLNFTSSNFNNIAALQTTLHFDNTKYEFIGIENGKLQLDYNASKANKSGNIAILWTDKNAEAKSFNKDEVLFTVVLKPLTVGSRLSTDIQLSNEIAETEAWDNSFTKRSIVLTSKENNSLPLANNQLLIYPNPSQTTVGIKLDKLTGTATLVITDVYGKQVFKKIINQSATTIDIGGFAKGVYMISAITEQGKQTQKLVVE